MEDVKILVVDDEEIVREFFNKFLSLENIEVKCVETGQEAIAAVKNGKFDLVFLDINMPVMNGLETFRELKKISPAVKCVMMTGYAAEDLMYAAKKEGVVASVQKPLDLGQIDSLLKEYTTLGKDRRVNILVVDDEDIVLTFFRRLLKSGPFEVTTLKTGKEALSLAIKKEFDMAFIDVGLSDINGVDLYLKLREIRPNLHLMLITGDPSRCDGIEHFGCLYKPFDINKILWEIDSVRILKEGSKG